MDLDKDPNVMFYRAHTVVKNMLTEKLQERIRTIQENELPRAAEKLVAKHDE